MLKRLVAAAVQDAIRATIVPQLDSYHQLWAQHNQEVSRALPDLEARVQELERSRNGHAIEISDLMERAERILARLRMRAQREGAAEEPVSEEDEQQRAFLEMRRR